MIVRNITQRERATLRPWNQPYAVPYRRKLDFAEQAEVVHLRLTRQASVSDLAARFGVSARTLHRYLHEYPDMPAVSAAGLRLMAEANRIGLVVTPADAERLASAALAERVA